MAKKKGGYFGEEPTNGHEEMDRPADDTIVEPAPEGEAEKKEDPDGGVGVTCTKDPALSGEYPTTEEALAHYNDVLQSSGTAEIIVVVDSNGVDREWEGEAAKKLMQQTVDYVYNKHRYAEHKEQGIEGVPPDRNLVI